MMDLKRLQACIKKFELQDDDKDGEEDLQDGVKQKGPQFQTKNKDFVDSIVEKDLETPNKETLLLNCEEQENRQAHITDNDLDARVKEKWAIKQGLFASASISSDKLFPKDSPSVSETNSCGLPALNTAEYSQDSTLFNSGSSSLDLRPKERILTPLGIIDTKQNRQEDHSTAGSTSERFPSLISDVPNGSDASGQSPYLDCRPKVRPAKSEISLQASPEFVDTFECEVLEEGAESTNRKWQNCDKHPLHKDFIPVKDFTLKHLPMAYRNQIYLKGIRSVAKVTVRLKVKYISTERPKEYTLAKYGGKRLPHAGTGFVYSRLFSDNFKSTEVPDCLMDNGRVDNGLEEHLAATCDGNRVEEKFQYLLERVFELTGKDKASLGTIQRRMKPVLKAVGGVKRFMETSFDCAGHMAFINDSRFTLDSVLEHFFEDEVDVDCYLPDLHVTRSIFGVNPSRPVTDFINKGKEGSFVLSLAYPFRGQPPVDDCEGDYGLLMRMKKREKKVKAVSSFLETLSDRYNVGEVKEEDVNDDSDDEDAVNSLNIDSDTDEDFDRDDKETHYEENADKHDDDSHDDNFDFRDDTEDNIHEVVNASSDTLQETFSIVSPCCCPDCETSKTPEPKGFYVNILTARHVVFDKEEAKYTVVDLFCDDESESCVAKLFGKDVHLHSHSGDLAILMCATHDRSLIEKLRILVEDMKENIEEMKVESDTPLAVICSHPHGYFKHVTIGEWVKRDIYRRRDGLPPLWTSYLYNTPTCAGSSGAPVVILGHKEGTLLLDSMLHPHQGRHNDTLNKSGRHISFNIELDQLFGGKAQRRASKEQRGVRRKVRQEMVAKWKEEANVFQTIFASLGKMSQKAMETKFSATKFTKKWRL